MSSIHTLIETTLREALKPERLTVLDESAAHAGHAGHNGSGESHFRVLIVSDAFSGKSRVDRHRMVNAVLGDDVGGRIHALALATYAPGEMISA